MRRLLAFILAALLAVAPAPGVIVFDFIAAASGGSYLVSEDFDGSGAPSGWTFNGTGTADYDYTSNLSPQGTHSLLVASNTNSTLGGAQFSLGGSYSDVWVYLQIRFGSVGSINRSVFLTNLTDLYVTTGGPKWGGFAGTTLSPSVSAATWYHCWIRLNATTQDIYFSTTATRPASPNATRSGSFGSVTTIILNSGHSSGMQFDKLRVSTTEIGSDPL